MSTKPVYVTRAASVFGARIVPSEEVDQAFGMPAGKLRTRAGIVSMAHAAETEDEVSLAAQASEKLVSEATGDGGAPNWVLTASETYHAYPSLAAALHAKLKLPERCAALDVGSGCLALLQALSVAQALLVSGQAKEILVATADVHSRTLGPGRAKGEFGGLFGDGASAFLLSTVTPKAAKFAYRLGEFFFGCAAQYKEAICVSEGDEGKLDIQFDGEALSRAAVNRMEQVLGEVERRSGISRREAGAFATHQPNPRLVALLAKQLGVPASAFPPIATTKGNLGSSMCGAALHAALERESEAAAGERKPVFLASLGPGLLFGGGWMVPAI